MNILIISSNYFPEPLGIGLYTQDLALMLKRQGHDVWVLTTFPYYPWWKTPKDLEKFAIEYSIIEEVHVYRTNLHFSNSRSTVGRIIFEVRMWLGLRRVFERIRDQGFEKVISIIPSLGAGLVARAAATTKKVPHFLVIQDITTNGVSESGMSLGSILRHFVRPIENRIIRSASSVAVISKTMVEAVKNLTGETTPVIHLANYETGSDSPISDVDRRKFDLPNDKFVIIHAGSIAKKQNLETLVATAKLLESSNVHFYLYGHGNAEEEISMIASGSGNFFIRPSVPRDQFKSLLECADLLVVNERPTQMSMALPSKLISYFGSRVPVLAAVPEGGATYLAVKDLAFWAEAGNPEHIAAEIKSAMKSKSIRDNYAYKAREHYEKELSAEAGQKRYLSWLFNSVDE